MAATAFRWCVEELETGLAVASGSAPTERAAAREVTHYAFVYSQDNPVRYWLKHGRKTLLKGEMASFVATIAA